MNYILWLLLATVFLACLASFAMKAEEEDGVQPPRHVVMSKLDTYTAQEVFNWVVYANKATNGEYIEQVNFPDTGEHTLLLNQLRRVNNYVSLSQQLMYYRTVAKAHDLSDEIVDLTI